jgi:hypothetical protein
MRPILAISVAIALAALVTAKPARKDAPAAVAEQGTTTPASIPLNARLIALETTYQLERGGLSAADYRKMLDAAKKNGQLLTAPKVALIFELQNKGSEEIQLLVGGDVAGTLRWQLKGPGAVSLSVGSRIETDDFNEPEVVKIAPGGSHRWVLKSLDCSGPRDQTSVYWTEPGDYLISAGFTVAVRPAPKFAVPHWYREDHANVAIVSGTVRVTVVEK